MRDQQTVYPQIGVANTCRSYEEYLRMFALEEEQLHGPILDVAGGASSFTAALCGRAIDARAADPFYQGDPDTVASQALKEIEVSTAKLTALKDTFDWSYYGSPERHRQLRLQSFDKFTDHYRSSVGTGRYEPASLPALPYEDGVFQMTFCSHFLFLYATQFGEEFHEEALRELLRVTKPGGEVRVYPLVSLQWEEADYIPALLERLADSADAKLITSQLPFVPVNSSILVLKCL